MRINWNKTTKPLRDRTCYGGLDLASVSDFTAWALLFEPDEPGDPIDILARFWCPEKKISNDPTNRYAQQYQAWKSMGFLTSTPGNAVDYDYVRQQIVKDFDTFNINSMNVDRLFEGRDFVMRLQEDIDDDNPNEQIVFPCGMGWGSIAVPMKQFEKLLLEKKLNHGNNPILTFCADNISVKMDSSGNLSPHKAESQGKIDGIVAIILALERMGKVIEDDDDEEYLGISYDGI